jgi:dihydroorotase
MMTQERFDLVLQGGRVIDPAQTVDQLMDVGVKSGRIAALEKSIQASDAKQVKDVKGKLVLPGLIDVHAHIYEHVTRPFGINADLAGVRSGATVLVDQGTASPFTFPGFRSFVVERATTRVYAFISAYVGGGLFANMKQKFLGPDEVDIDLLVDVIEANRDIVRGIKVHAEAGGASRWGLEPLRRAKEASRRAGVPVYVHLGAIHPIATEHEGGHKVDTDKLVVDATAMLDKGDFLAHIFRPDEGCFMASNGEPNPGIVDAIKRGVHVDHGRGWHFSFTHARKVLDAGLKPDTLGVDSHGLNFVPNHKTTRQGIIRFGVEGYPIDTKNSPLLALSMASVMTEILALGVPLYEVIGMVTSNAADVMGFADEHGTLKVGRTADVTVMDLEKGSWRLRDPRGGEQMADRRFVPDFVLRAGEYHVSDVRVPDAEPDALPLAS